MKFIPDLTVLIINQFYFLGVFMLNFRSILIGVLFFLPLVSNASTLSFISTDHENKPAEGKFPFTGSGTGSVRVPLKTVLSFNDELQLAVDTGETAKIEFSATDTNALSFSNFSVLNLTTNTTSSIFDKLAAGNYTFKVSGTTDGSIGGLYKVQTAITAVPVPATFWLMSSAIFGLISFGKRRVS